jgi:type IV pilus assembly protein PilV
MSRLSFRRHSGVSLIEVMIAVVVLSIGLLGVGTLMAVSLRNTQSAGYRTQAADIAYEFTDMARAYIADGANSKAQLLRRDAFGAPNCNLAAAPGYNCGNDSNALACDIDRVDERVCRVLPDGRIRANFAPIPGGGSRLALTVDVCWSDDRSQTAAQTGDCSSSSESMYRLITEI